MYSLSQLVNRAENPYVKFMVYFPGVYVLLTAAKPITSTHSDHIHWVVLSQQQKQKTSIVVYEPVTS